MMKFEDRIQFIMSSVKNKDEVKATTTLQFKKDLIDILIHSEFDGDILEVGTSSGYTTAILCAIAEYKSKHVYSFEHDITNIYEATKRCSNYGFSNYSIINTDVYRDKWIDILKKERQEYNGIGCVFIDCVHTEKCFKMDLENSSEITIADPIIFAHDYGLVTKDGDRISWVLEKNKDKYGIVRFLGEKEGWNKLGSGKVVDWEGVQIAFKDLTRKRN